MQTIYAERRYFHRILNRPSAILFHGGPGSADVPVRIRRACRHAEAGGTPALVRFQLGLDG
ncbi:MAG: hypothetical protein L0312_05465 [Acidobacteria bacterium]|nr:hypothetical protein [Acidobacteriota bacterium]